jgi:cytochrome c-type biogenesis protein CcmH/NrfG
VSAAQWLAIAVIGLPALALVLWPLLRGGAGPAPAAHDGGPDRTLELTEEKATVYRSLKELAFDHEAGHLSDDDYRELRDRYEGRAADLISRLDALGAPASRPAKAPPETAPEPRPWTRGPAALVAGTVAVLALGIGLGVGISRYTAPDQTVVPPGSRVPVPALPDPGPLLPGAPGTGAASMRPIPPEMLARMLQAARQSLFDGRYQEAIAAYQAVLKRDPKNVDAMTHLALIVAMGGHADAALETFDKALSFDPKYGPALLYKGQVLYEVKQDYAGAIKAWERYLALGPAGEDRQRVAALIQEARSKAPRP